MNTPHDTLTASSVDHARADAVLRRARVLPGLAASIAAGLLGLAGPVAAAEFEVEGILSEVVPAGQSADGFRQIVCNGAKIRIRNGTATAITSPTAKLTFVQLRDTTKFPYSGHSPLSGAERTGFIGGTCIVTGNDDTIENGAPVKIADTVFVEIAENVIVGNGRYDSTINGFTILGVPIVPLTDARMGSDKTAAGLYKADSTGLLVAPSEKESARNEYGFGVNLNTIGVAAPDFSAAEGYLGSDGKLYAHTIETSGGDPLYDESSVGTVYPVPRASILRAQCRNEAGGGRDRMEIRGGCLMARNSTGNVTVTLASRNAAGAVTQTLGTASCVRDPASPQGRYGLYRFQNDRMTLVNNVCPASVSAHVSTPQPAVVGYDLAPAEE